MQLAMDTNVGLSRRWTHPSVLALAGDSDPFATVVRRAREIVLNALESGWSGPPYDPFMLAETLGIAVQPSQDVVDARTFPGSSGGFRIEFNPNRARPRVNYSIAHEIAHTLFPDCARAIRNRYTHADTKPEDWQLEMLCNVAASEFLMPIGSFSIDERRSASIDKILEWRNKYSVSTEAILLRYAKLALQPSLVFTAHRDESRTPGRYCIDYAIPSRTWTTGIRTGFLLPAGSAVEECTGIGFTAKSEEVWVASDGPCRVECVGVPSYPGSTYPRVMGLLAPKSKRVAAATAVSYLTGDAASPRGPGKKVIVQLVNDKALTWGRGFAVAVRKKWPEAQRAFSDWALTHKGEFRLGGVHFTKLDSNVELASLVAQHGYGPSPHTRLRYAALDRCLDILWDHASKSNAGVHMPRIGCGEARGNWEVVSEIIDASLCRRGIKVTVYDLPGAERTAEGTSAWLFGHSA